MQYWPKIDRVLIKSHYTDAQIYWNWKLCYLRSSFHKYQCKWELEADCCTLCYLHAGHVEQPYIMYMVKQLMGPGSLSVL